MALMLKVLFTVMLGTALGLGATAIAINRDFPFGGITSGPWIAHPTIGAPAIDPYARAILARTAFVPVGADEGIAFHAATDTEGRPLLGNCEYRLDSADPSSRFWTLGFFDRRGAPVDTVAGRRVLTSQDVLRIDGRVPVVIAADVRDGNWLPGPQTGPFTLVYTLYEPIGGTGSAAAFEAGLPDIRRTGCSP